MRRQRSRWLATCALATACSGEDDGSGDATTAGDGTESSAATTDASAGTSSSTSSATADASTGAAESTDGGGSGESGAVGGCGNDPGARGTVTQQIEVDGMERTYVLSIPQGYDPSQPYPLVVAFHGRGGDGELAQLYFGLEAEIDGAAIVAYPNGLPIASMGGQTGWDLAPLGMDVAFFDALVAELQDNLCVDDERIFATGHSFGGYFSNALGCFRPDVLRAIAPVAGGPPFAACGEGLVAGWMAHGTMDAVVDFSQGEAARDSLLARNGCGSESAAVEPSPCVSYDGCAEGFPVHWCAHDEAAQSGHVWPAWAGPAIWAFFASLAPE